jgi:hypothetical protein
VEKATPNDPCTPWHNERGSEPVAPEERASVRRKLNAACLKTITEVSPADWLPLAKRRRVTIVDSDLGTIVSGATDKLFRVHDHPEYLLHLDFQAGHFNSQLPLRLPLYNTVFEYRYQLVVLSVVEGTISVAASSAPVAGHPARLLEIGTGGTAS